MRKRYKIHCGGEKTTPNNKRSGVMRLESDWGDAPLTSVNLINMSLAAFFSMYLLFTLQFKH